MSLLTDIAEGIAILASVGAAVWALAIWAPVIVGVAS